MEVRKSAWKMSREFCDYFNTILDLVETEGPNGPVIYSRSYFNSNRDFNHYPIIEIESIPNYTKLYNSNFVQPFKHKHISCHGITTNKISKDLISSTLLLDWNNQPKIKNYDEDTLQTFNDTIDLEFKNCFLLSKIKSEKYPNEPISKKLFDVLIQNYLNNLVFSRWLYNDFIEYKTFVKQQKKRRRVNHKNNVRDRLNNVIPSRSVETNLENKE